MWIFSLVYKFPPYANSAFIKSALGMVESLHKKLGERIAKGKTSVDTQYNVNKQRFSYVE